MAVTAKSSTLSGTTLGARCERSETVRTALGKARTSILKLAKNPDNAH